MKRIAFHITALPNGMLGLAGNGHEVHCFTSTVECGGETFRLPIPPDLAIELLGKFNPVDIDISIEIPEE